MKELLDYYKPFEDFEKSAYDNVFTRVFKEDVEKVTDYRPDYVLFAKGLNKGNGMPGWKLQMDNDLPFELEVGQNYHINKEEFHRLHKGNSDLKLEIKEYD